MGYHEDRMDSLLAPRVPAVDKNGIDIQNCFWYKMEGVWRLKDENENSVSWVNYPGFIMPIA